MIKTSYNDKNTLYNDEIISFNVERTLIKDKMTSYNEKPIKCKTAVF